MVVFEKKTTTTKQNYIILPRIKIFFSLLHVFKGNARCIFFPSCKSGQMLYGYWLNTKCFTFLAAKL